MPTGTWSKRIMSTEPEPAALGAASIILGFSSVGVFALAGFGFRHVLPAILTELELRSRALHTKSRAKPQSHSRSHAHHEWRGRRDSPIDQHEAYRRLLGVSRGATAAEIKRAFYACAKSCHPDTSSDPEAGRKFAILKAAYETLKSDCCKDSGLR